MNIRNLTIICLLFYSCSGSIGAGTLGGWETIVFPTSEQTLDSAINTFFVKNPEYNVPNKWIYEKESWSNRGYGFLKSVFFYFQNSPEEMLYVTFVNDPDAKDTDRARIAIRSVYSEGMEWKEYDQYTDEERKVIQVRFDKEIRSRLEKYANVTSYTDK